MKDRFIAICALFIAVASLSYTAWLHQQSRQLVETALKERELKFVKANAPKVKRVYSDMLGGAGKDFDPEKFDPNTLEELIYPMVITVQRMTGASEGAERPQ